MLSIIYLLLYNSYEIVETIKFSFNICINNLFPSLIPFMLISNILIDYNFIESLNEFLTPITKLLKISKHCSFIIIMSILSGTPSNSIYIKELFPLNSILNTSFNGKPINIKYRTKIDIKNKLKLITLNLQKNN